MSQEASARVETTEHGITILCPECGQLIEVKDVRAVLLTLHLRNDCDISGLFSHGSGE